MIIKEIENKIHTQIPMTKLMKLELKDLNETQLITTAPLDINVNDKGTAFGGSLNSITIISSWCMAYYLSKKLNIENTSIVIFKNETKFIRPVTKDIVCTTFIPNEEEQNSLKSKINTKNSASIKIHSQIIENDKVCVDFYGVYIIKT
ncbi:YiiD C-terminal domain-containing protein [Arcobacter sp. F2176]|uniref:YiiD C-terminal domain-containing protein n=1 Tax=Arcobacter sp. F2176 TaxID=2044511 RepID=UPI00100BF5D1|nr:YiiD C-terminal domain-containing protein [Arcobacter sp. F2176]RXJ82018.1 thioesterase [Arcobacter sp. F2176]